MRSPSRSLAALLALAGWAGAMSDRGTPEPGIGVEEWNEGWTMLVGAGLSRSRYMTENEQVEQSGKGPNLATAFGRCDASTCLEFGSLVSFNYYEDMQATLREGKDTIELDAWMWETALFLALRSRFPGVPEKGNLNPWIKLLGGYGASVGYSNRIHAPGMDSLKDWRIQDEGPLFGLSLSNIFGRNRPGRIWFVEYTALVQLHWNSWIVKSGGLLPNVQSTYHSQGNPYSVLMNLTVGFRVF